MLAKCWPTVRDAGPKLGQQRVNASYLLGKNIAGEEAKGDKSIWPPSLGWYRSGFTYTQQYDYDVLFLC